VLAAGHVWEGRSRYGDKLALFADCREIAHLEQDGTIDLRITRARQDFAADPAVLHDPGRRDWIELRPKHASDLDRLAPLLTITAAANATHTPFSQPPDVTLTDGQDRRFFASPLTRPALRSGRAE
jgi:Family of unknown function (DUF5519)